MSASERTKYPNIYKYSYWGNFKENMDITDEIIGNRNEFKEEYKIKKAFDMPKYIEKHIEEELKTIGFIDHLECYKTEDKKYILLSSPYDDIDGTYTKAKYEGKGWMMIKQLYSRSAQSYIKIIEMGIQV